MNDKYIWYGIGGLAVLGIGYIAYEYLSNNNSSGGGIGIPIISSSLNPDNSSNNTQTSSQTIPKNNTATNGQSINVNSYNPSQPVKVRYLIECYLLCD